VSSRTADQDGRVERLRADYKGAFDEWALQVSHLRKVKQSVPDSLGEKEAEERAEAAQIAYRDSRDRLAEDLTGRLLG
jgi:hypothetical protein